jgi:hypothetical protein
MENTPLFHEKLYIILKEDNIMNNITTKTQPQMMTIRAAAKTGILPENAIRVMVKQGLIPAVYSGTKAFINYDTLCAYLQNLTITNKGGQVDA